VPFKDSETQKKYQKRRHKTLYKNPAYRAATLTRVAQWDTKHPQRTNERKIKHNLGKFGLTPLQYEQMLQRQNGMCAICQTPPAGQGHGSQSSLHIDHDHKTNRNRALLCGNCNRGLGMFQDNPNLLLLAAEYLKKHTHP
jgi:hypothetical protein